MTVLRYSRPGDFFTNQLMNQLFRETKDSFKNAAERESGFHPATNIIEEENYYLIEMAIPGLSKKEISINVEDGFLKISGEKKEQQTDTKFLRKEFGIKKVERNFKLADAVNKNNISAEVKDGILNVVLPKVEKVEPEVQNIEVK
ncbi:Hsp20/alpha crystallin family protein [Marinifilum sp. RC60d5]|uniref:Hsp20/alpha crystallin family protein n=1 Tax=Marinifilum sp. RC60d5 TaxID=3458414 RepID=UPI00403735C9